MLDATPGSQFGYLTVVQEGPRDSGRNRTAVCKCTCGTTKTVRLSNLHNGDTTSCGCQKAKSISAAKAVHGMAGTHVYGCWQSMKARCYRRSTAGYERYGGRGIIVCDRWKKSFEAFYADMGDPPSDQHSVERKDVNGNYEPGNCTWATDTEQANNRRNTVYITHDGRTESLATWARELGIPKNTLRMRLHRGWTPAETLNIARP